MTQPGDHYEQEADRVAEQVMQTPFTGNRVDAGIDVHPGLKVMRSANSPGAGDTMEAPPVVHEVLQSPGAPMDRPTRNFFEPRLGRDFGDVRVHTGSKAVESARALSAQAYTVGSHVVFDHGAFAPHTDAGRRLLAHELVHVGQQSGSASLLLQRQCRTGSECAAPICGDPGVYAERIDLEESGGAGEGGTARPRAGAPPATGHGSRATSLIRLAGEWGIDLSDTGGVYISEDIASGGESMPCNQFEGWGAAYRTLTFDRNTWCIFVRPEDEALAAELLARPAAGSVERFGREIHYLRRLLLHERGHVEYETESHATLGATSCRRDTVIMTGPGPRPYSYDMDFYLSELSAIISEFPPLLQATRRRVSNYASILHNLRSYFSHAALGCDESIRGVLTALRCHCPCAEVDAYVRDTFLFASRNWSDSERGIFQDLMRSRFPSVGWPRISAAELSAGPATAEPDVDE